MEIKLLFSIIKQCVTPLDWPQWHTTISAKFRCSIINIYNSCSIENRALVWRIFFDYFLAQNSPCFIIGDFNEVLKSSERGGQAISNQGVHEFEAFIIIDMGLIEIYALNGHFTWFRGQSKSKLDRLLVQFEWITAFLSLKLSLLNKNLSDHVPLIPCSNDSNWGPRPFPFLNSWLTHPQCMNIIKDSWSKSHDLSVTKKLSVVKENLKQWNIQVFGIIDDKIIFF